MMTMKNNKLIFEKSVLKEIKDYFSSRVDPDYMKWDPDSDDRATVDNLMNEDTLAPWDEDEEEGTDD